MVMTLRASLVGACFAILAFTAGAQSSDARAATAIRVFRIEAQPLPEALTQWADQANMQVLWSAKLSSSQGEAPEVEGRFTADVALEHVLQGSGLTYAFVDPKTVSIRLASAAVDVAASSPSKGDGEGNDQGMKRSAEGAVQSSPFQGEGRGEDSKESIAEVIVTGSHITGGETVAPVRVYTQRDFDQAGAATAQQFLSTLPQNFGGGQGDFTSNEPGLQFNPSFGTAVNLRGVGSGATLTLVNGNRWAVGGSAEFVDISMIPLSAVERIEVMADGASAIYGSDAIGGVVNFIMRKNYEGADTRIRYGSTTRGGGTEYQVAQSFGTIWSGGSGLLSYEYYRRDSVNSVDRDFSSGTVGPLGLTPSQKRHSVYASAQQDLFSGFNVSVDGFYSTRDAQYLDYDPSAVEANTYAADTQQYGGSLGMTYQLTADWNLGFNAGSSRNSIQLDGKSPTLLLNSTQTHFKLSSADLNLDGLLFSLPTGDVKIAIGGSYREEAYNFEDRFSRFQGESATKAAYAELLVPLMRSRRPDAGEAPLLLTLAGRYEKYDTFGETVDPKIGLRWSLTNALTVRGTYGTSFKAPSLYQLNEFNGTYLLTNVVDPLSTTGFTRSVVLTGNNADLHEETATTWSLGLAWHPEFSPSLNVELTYFDIAYSDRIQSSGLPSRSVINNPSYAELTTRRNPSNDAAFNARISDLLSGRIRSSGCALPVDPATRACAEPVTNFLAIVDNRLANMAGMNTNGLDLDANQNISSEIGDIALRLNASYLFHYNQRVSDTAPIVERISTAQSPVDLRMRASATWSRNDLSATATLNYTDGYLDKLGAAPIEIPSWTTFDMVVGYDMSTRGSGTWLAGVTASLSILNIFDRDPPYFAHEAVGLGYDPSNANPLGRSIAATISKRW